jgi:hypothetical protein
VSRRRARGPILAVLITSALLLGGARLIGRVAASRQPGRGGASGSPQQAAVDLSFYRVLGDAPPKAKGSDSTLRAAPGDLVPEKGIYVVQVLASADEEQAKRMKERLAAKGFQASSLQDTASGAWRVRVGRWAERGPAEAMAERIRKATGLQPWVLREGER